MTAPVATAQRATSAEWRAVNGDLASITRANASATRSSRSSPAVSTRSAGSQSATGGTARGSSSGAPERAVVAHRQQRVDERGIEPAAAALERHRERAGQAERAHEHLERLRQAQDPAEQRDLLAAQPERLAGAVPVLVERADRLRGALRQLEHARDLGAALAARADHLARDLVLLREPAHLPRLGQRPAAGGDRAPRVQRQRAAARPVGDLHRALGRVVVGGEQRRQPGRVARAAGVLEQQRVEQRRALLLPQADLLGQPHADRGRADRVAGRLALGDVERVRERRRAPPRARRRITTRLRSSASSVGGRQRLARAGSPGRGRSRARVSRSSWPSVSTPSGMTPMPSARAMPTIASTIAPSPSPSSPRPATNARSTFRPSSG